MANTTFSGPVKKTFYIDKIIEEAYERIGMAAPRTGQDLESTRRSLNIMFQEWANRGLHYWEVASNTISMVNNQSTYTIYRSAADGTSDGTFSYLNGAIDCI
jgi:hypothetical protein